MALVQRVPGAIFLFSSEHLVGVVYFASVPDLSSDYGPGLHRLCGCGGNAHGMMGFVHNTAFLSKNHLCFFTECCVLNFQYVEHIN